METVSMEKLTEIVCSSLGISTAEYNDELNMQASVKWDSLNHMRLITAIEEQFQLDIDMDDIIEMTAISTIKTVLKEKYHVI